MNRALAVLIVEASESDACRLVDWLSAAGYRVASARVETAAQMRAALAAQPWDVVIADCNLPQFSGAAALALLQEAGLDIAFIAVSGAQGEEAAAIIMKAGAHDYLLKSNLARLVPVIERELGQAESRRLREETEAALQASEARYRDLVENSHDLICTHDLEGNLLFVNQAAAIIFGYSSEALAQMNLRDLLPPKLRPLADAYLTEIRTQGYAAGVMQVRTAGGETRYLDYRNSLQQKSSTEPVAYSVARDITARIRAEAAMRVSQAQVTGIIATAMDAIITADAEQRIVIFNPAAEAMFGCSQTEACGQPLDRFIPARFRASHRLHIQRFAQTGVSARKIGQFGPVYGLRADGVEFPIEASISKIHVAGQDLFTVILRDVSAREQAAQALRRQLDTLHSLYQITALISQTEAVTEVYTVVLDSLHGILAADRTAILLLDAAGVARFEVWRGLSDAYRRAVAGHFPWSLDDPAPQPILAPDVQRDASLASFRAVFADEGIGALAFIPLSHQGRLLGKFMIYYNTPHAFSAEEIELAQTIARHVAFAIARKQATEALAASERQLRALFASMQDVVLVIDREGVYRGIAPTNPALLVRPAEELLGKTLRDIFPATEAEFFAGTVQRVLQTQQAVQIEYEATFGESTDLPMGDRRVWFEASISPLTDDSTLWVARDVTAHKQAAATLQRQLQALTVLHAVASACIEASDEDDLIIRLTQLVSAALALDDFGLFLVDEVGLLRPHPSYRQSAGTRVESYRPGQGVVGQTALTGQSHRVDDVRLDPDYVAATPTTLSELAVPVKIGERVIAVINAESQQVSTFSAEDERLLSTLAGQVATALERLRLWQQTQEQARRVQQIVDTVPEGVLLLDAQGRVVLANPTAGRDLATLAGAAVGDIITRLGDLPLTELLLPATRGPWRETTAHDRTFQMIARPIGDTSEPAAWVLVINDVTYERERQRYRQAQERLASVGQMAAGIAHDFNNIMGAIVLYSELLGKAQELAARPKHYLGVIRQQADHAANLIRQILDFSRRAPMERAPLDLLSLTKEMVKLLERTLPESIRLAVKYDRREVIVHGDPTRLQQVLMNLALNARDAMPDGGQLTFSLTTLTLAPGQTPPLPDLGPGRWGCLTVSDSGAGIAPEHLAHIFEPFFTTKDVGQGTGLGLAQVHGIVKQHDGAIDVSSKPGAGAAFTIYLPHVNTPAPTEARGVTVATLPSGTETILLVEDNVATREAIGESLAGLGYRVLPAATGAEALALWAAQGHEIDLVLSDLVMPEMGGLELFRRLRAQAPALKMLIMTGHAPEGDIYADMRLAGVPWLQKPFTIADLATRLRTVLDGQPPAGDTGRNR